MIGSYKTKIIIDPKEECNKPTNSPKEECKKPTNSYILYHFIKTRNLKAKTPQEETTKLKKIKCSFFLTIYILYATKESRDQ